MLEPSQIADKVAALLNPRNVVIVFMQHKWIDVDGGKSFPGVDALIVLEPREDALSSAEAGLA